VRDSLRDNAYGIYLVHCLFAFWLQFVLLGTDVPAIAKVAAVFVATLAVSWGAAAVLRRIPGFALVLGTGRRTSRDLPTFAPPLIPFAD
jgi:surface polysaccharide O-acyltransferase-like enzyme